MQKFTILSTIFTIFCGTAAPDYFAASAFCGTTAAHYGARRLQTAVYGELASRARLAGGLLPGIPVRREWLVVKTTLAPDWRRSA